TADTLRIGAVTVPGAGLTTTAGSIVVAGAAFDATAVKTLELDATTTGGGTGDVGQSKSLLNVGTLTGTAASVTLTDTGNTISNVGPLTASTGNIALNDSAGLTIAGTVKSTAGNVYLETSNATGITFGAAGTVQSAASGIVGLQADAVVNLGTTGATGVVKATSGIFELASDTAGKTVTLGTATGLSLTNVTGITAGTLRIGAVTLPGAG